MSRVRCLFRAALRAPWSGAAPVVLILAAVITTGLVVTDDGGWRQVFGTHHAVWVTTIVQYGDGSAVPRVVGHAGARQFMLHGAAWYVELAALLIACAARGWRWPTVALTAAMAYVLAQWVGQGTQHLGFITAVVHQVPTGRDSDGQLEISITMYAVVALLLAAALTTALLWAVAGTRQRRRDPSRRHNRPSRRAAALTILAAYAATLPLPRIAMWARDIGRDLFHVPATRNEQTIYLLVLAMALIYLAATLLSRRQPALATAALVIGAALWIPALWLITGIVVTGTFLGNGAVALTLWALWFTGGTLAGMRTAARAAHATTA